LNLIRTIRIIKTLLPINLLISKNDQLLKATFFQSIVKCLRNHYFQWGRGEMQRQQMRWSKALQPWTEIGSATMNFLWSLSLMYSPSSHCKDQDTMVSPAAVSISSTQNANSVYHSSFKGPTVPWRNFSLQVWAGSI
jgi:hypothetical protein